MALVRAGVEAAPPTVPLLRMLPHTSGSRRPARPWLFVARLQLYALKWARDVRVAVLMVLLLTFPMLVFVRIARGVEASYSFWFGFIPFEFTQFYRWPGSGPLYLPVEEPATARAQAAG